MVNESTALAADAFVLILGFENTSHGDIKAQVANSFSLIPRFFSGSILFLYVDGVDVPGYD